MKKLPKIINRYTSSPDYYSYEKDYLYEIKQVINRYPFSSNPCEIVDTITKAMEKGEKLDETTIYHYLLLGSFTEVFPTYYVHNNFIELTYKTGIKTNISLSSPFIEKAVFLYPKYNSINIVFSIVFYLDDKIHSYHRFKSNQLLHTIHLTNDLFNGKELSNEDFTNRYLIPLQQRIYEPSSENVFVLIANIFLYMSAYKEEGMKIIKEHSTNGIGFKQGKSRLLTPPTIGFSEKEYVENQHRLVSIPNPDLQGIKKQTHWRRGHWRQYDNGKLTWIRPCLVNPLNDDLN